MDFDDLIRFRPPPPNRMGKCDGEHEHHLDEGAVMVAFAMHLIRTEGVNEVRGNTGRFSTSPVGSRGVAM
jgi:hypothetical protein